jgi:hypothetical protein
MLTSKWNLLWFLRILRYRRYRSVPISSYNFSRSFAQFQLYLMKNCNQNRYSCGLVQCGWQSFELKLSLKSFVISVIRYIFTTELHDIITDIDLFYSLFLTIFYYANPDIYILFSNATALTTQNKRNIIYIKININCKFNKIMQLIEILIGLHYGKHKYWKF